MYFNFDYDLAIILILALYCFCLSVIIIKSKLFFKRRKIIISNVMLLIVFGALMQWFSNKCSYHSDLRVARIIFSSLEFYSTVLIGVLLSEAIGHKPKKPKMHLLLYLPVIVNTICLLINAFTGFIFTVTENANYIHGDFYWIYILLYAISLFFVVFTIIKEAITYQNRSVFVVSILLSLITMGIIFELVLSYSLYWIIVTLATSAYVYYFSNIIVELDPITKVFNRSSYESKIEHFDTKKVYIMIDLNDFKYINDTFGHETGDLVLENTAIILKRVYAKVGLVYRIGGDEFVVLQHKDIYNPENYITRLRSEIAKEKKSNYKQCTLSIGYIEIDPTLDIKEQINVADELMYLEKKEYHEKRGTAMR